MLRKSFVLPAMLFYALLHCSSLTNAQSVSVSSGFYPVDSVFFTVNSLAPQGGKIEISVNCFTNSNCFTEYKTGVWLYNRNQTPNTWENQQFSRAPSGGAVDTLAPRGTLDKVNVVRVRILSQQGSIVSDSAYFIGVLGKGASYPYTLPVVQLLVDSMDAFGPLGFYGPGEGIDVKKGHTWNYLLDQTPRYNSYIPRSRVEKACVVQVTDKHQHLLFYQNCGIQTTGNESRSLPNKSLEVVSRKEYSNSDAFSTDLLGNGKETFHSIRFRSGGSGQRYGFGVHEIGERIIAGLNIGEVPVQPVITFLNGSYWSLSFAQADIEESSPKDIKEREQISIFKPQYFVLDNDLINNLHQLKVDSQTITWSKTANGKIIGTSMVLHGKKDLFMAVSNRIMKSSGGKPLTFADIDGLIDLNSWLTYIALVDFGRIKSSIQHHVLMGTAPGKKMFLLVDEIKDFAMADPAGNHWKERILVTDTDEETFESFLIKDVILKNKECVEKLCLRYEDLLNTNFNPENTIPVIDNLKAEFLPEYEKYWQSWTPNSGLNITDETNFLEGVKTFCKTRPDTVWKQMADQWLPNSHLQLTDRKTVHVVMDSVPAGTVKVHLNSLVITKDWNGLYYPDPALEVSMEALNVPDGYVLAWKEQPDMALTLKLPAKNETTLTPVLRKKK